MYLLLSLCVYAGVLHTTFNSRLSPHSFFTFSSSFDLFFFHTFLFILSSSHFPLSLSPSPITLVSILPSQQHCISLHNRFHSSHSNHYHDHTHTHHAPSATTGAGRGQDLHQPTGLVLALPLPLQTGTSIWPGPATATATATVIPIASTDPAESTQSAFRVSASSPTRSFPCSPNVCQVRAADARVFRPCTRRHVPSRLLPMLGRTLL
jgi:hypothetical protein